MLAALVALICVHDGNIGGAVVALAIGHAISSFTNRWRDEVLEGLRRRHNL